jgi:Type II secretory pathway, prepilin signal peptidase PulO and related peptidases
MILFVRDSLESVAGVPEIVGYIFAFLFGAVIGSFLNVVIHRVPNEESIVFPNSACPKCGSGIKAYDNIPILSWLVLGGKCRNCKEPISPRYPAVEVLTALLYLAVYWQIGFGGFLPVALVFVSVMLALVFIDSEHMILPNVITYPLLGFAVLVRVIFPSFFAGMYISDLNAWPISQFNGLHPIIQSVLGALLGALVGGGFLWAVGELWKRLRGVDAMGLGDVKMMAAVGALLGWRLTLLSTFLGAFSGALIGVVMIARQKDRDLQTQIPFGIFLGIGSIIAMLFGDRLIAWYLTTFIQY